MLKGLQKHSANQRVLKPHIVKADRNMFECIPNKVHYMSWWCGKWCQVKKNQRQVDDSLWSVVNEQPYEIKLLMFSCYHYLSVVTMTTFPVVLSPGIKPFLLFSLSGHSSLFPMEDGFPDDERGDQGLAGLGSPHCFPHQNGERVERYSRKVFVGGLPPDIDEGKAVTLRSKMIISSLGTENGCNLREMYTIRCHPILHLWTDSECVASALFQMRLQPVSGVLDICLWTGLTKQRANLIFPPKVC